MNWMGGNLSRHRRGRGWKEDTARQKEYFARARTRQRERMKPSPVALAAANFIPNYTPPLEATTSPARADSSLSMLFSQPLCAANEAPANLEVPSKGMQRGVAELPLFVPPSQKDVSTMLNNQSVDDHVIGAPDLEAERRRRLRNMDGAVNELPKKPSVREFTRRRKHSTIFRHISEQRQQLGTSTGYHVMPSMVGRQRGKRKSKMSQIPSSPSPRSVRIRIGSQDYRWSEAKNSIRIPTHGDCSSNGSAEEIGREAHSRNADDASYITNETFTGSPSSSSSSLPWSSPCNNRLSRRRGISHSTGEVVRGASVECQRQAPTCACGSLLKSLSPKSETESTVSMIVEVSDGEGMPEIELDEERAWRQWLG
ncbi:hypothetical protein V8C37DRAFT_372896 [Trichoderma ceciliae]